MEVVNDKGVSTNHTYFFRKCKYNILCISQCVADQRGRQGDVLVISCYKDNIIVITRDWGGAKVKFNNIDIIRVVEYNWFLPQIK